MENEKLLIGWKEWCALPDLGIPAIKGKVDTGARTSSLNASNMTLFKKNAVKYVQFVIYPLHRFPHVKRTCVAPLYDNRPIKNSGGFIEERFVIKTRVFFEDRSFEIELTLTDREEMLFSLLIGRMALKDRFIIDPSRSYCFGKKKQSVISNLYQNQNGIME